MDLKNSSEPLAKALAAAAVIAGAIVAAVNGMTDAPDWVTRYLLPIAGIVATVLGGGAVARKNVWADKHVHEVVRTLDAEIAEIPAEYLGPDIPTPPVDDVDDVLDEAARAAGLD